MDGSPAYLAPECYLKENYGRGVDVWALGLIFYEQVWRSVGGVKPTDGAKYPEFVQKAMGIYRVEAAKIGNQLWWQDMSKVGKALCSNQKIGWPDGLPESGKSIKHLVSWALTAQAPRIPKGQRKGLVFRVDPVDLGRCTAEQFLEKVPKGEEL